MASGVFTENGYEPNVKEQKAPEPDLSSACGRAAAQAAEETTKKETE